jgi:hypothetical protein
MDQMLLVYLGFVSLEESGVVKQFSWNSFVNEVKSKRSNNKHLVAQVFWQFLQELLLQTLYAFEESFSNSAWETSTKCLRNSNSDSFELQTLLKTSHNAFFVQTVDTFVLPLVKMLLWRSTTPTSGTMPYLELVKGLFLLGLWRFALLLPSSPVDPLHKPFLKCDVRGRCQVIAFRQVLLRKQLEQLVQWQDLPWIQETSLRGVEEFILASGDILPSLLRVVSREEDESEQESKVKVSASSILFTLSSGENGLKAVCDETSSFLLLEQTLLAMGKALSCVQKQQQQHQKTLDQKLPLFLNNLVGLIIEHFDSRENKTTL